MDYAIEIEGLTKKYPGAEQPAVDGLTVNIPKGIVFGMLGPNGAGKSTTINILCGLLRPDRGRARMLGMDCIADASKIHGRIGIVPQEIALFGELTCMENIRYIGRLYGLSEEFIETSARDRLERLGLSHSADRLIKTFSGGMRRRANIIVSLLHEPELLVLDEPTAGVDVQSRALINSFLMQYKEKGNTILYTSHLMHEAESMCDEVMIIDNGRLITSGSPQWLIANTAGCKDLEEVFLHYTGRTVRE